MIVKSSVKCLLEANTYLVKNYIGAYLKLWMQSVKGECNLMAVSGVVNKNLCYGIHILGKDQEVD